MQVLPSTVSPALKALLSGFIDYAGIYPPAALPLDTAVANYGQYRDSDYSWMLRWLVIGDADLAKVPPSLDGCLSVLAEKGDIRAATVESKGIVKAAGRPVYCEVATNSLQQLDEVKASGCYAKIRTGGLKPEAIPSPENVAAFIIACAERRLPFKATAGLHHPLRKDYPLTYEADAPVATMHGFINVLMAAAFAWQGERDIVPIIDERDASAFSFDENAHWRGKSLTLDEVNDARSNFIHSVGSCSFDEPVGDLKTLGFL
ncbi:MAG: hypothetical protein K2X93_25770 [Candidatus Obscuribacterales bacterium]|nr:hypothetical protein [Candidatus Obscuribacterales bacterium]